MNRDLLYGRQSVVGELWTKFGNKYCYINFVAVKKALKQLVSAPFNNVDVLSDKNFKDYNISSYESLA